MENVAVKMIFHAVTLRESDFVGVVDATEALTYISKKMRFIWSFWFFYIFYSLSTVDANKVPNAKCVHLTSYPPGKFLMCGNENLKFPDTFNVSAIGMDLEWMDISCPSDDLGPCNLIGRNYEPFPRRDNLKELRLSRFMAEGERRIPLPHLLVNLRMTIVKLTVQLSEIGYLDVEYFRGFQALEVLNLQNNDIAQIAVDTFHALTMPPRQPVLSKIDMDGNFLDVLDWSVFYPIRNSLKSLDIRRQLSGLDQIFMSGTDFVMQLQDLYLVNNNLTELPSRVLQSIAAPKIYAQDQNVVYDFTDNKLCSQTNCTCCEIEDFMLWAANMTRFSAIRESKVTVKVSCGRRTLNDMSTAPLDFFATCPNCSKSDPREFKCPPKRNSSDSDSDAVLTTGAVVGIAVACSVLLAAVVVLIAGWRRKVGWAARKPTSELARPDVEEEELTTELDSAPSSVSGQHRHSRYQHSGISTTSSEKGVTDPVPEDYEVKTLGSDCSYDYKPRDYIAKGSYGRVYIAKIVERGNFTGEETVVVKVTHLDKDDKLLIDNKNWLKLLARWRLLISLTYKHLVAYHKVSIIKARGCVSVEFLMEYYSGGDLALALHKLKQTNEPLDRGRAICYAIQIAQGLEFLHKQRLIHGDLKPGNILLKPNEDRHQTAVIGDLDNIVQMHHNTTSVSDMSNLHGTIRYMSPEMLQKFGGVECDAPGRAADIWSMGCIVHDLFDSSCGICGRVLYKANSADFTVKDNTLNATFAMKIMEGYVPRVSEQMPVQLSVIVKYCLTINSKERRPAEILIGDLRSLVSEFVGNGGASLALEIDSIRQCICGKHL